MASQRTWKLCFKGGFADGTAAQILGYPEVLVFCWPCSGRDGCATKGCRAHITFNVDHAPTHALAYRRIEISEEQAVAVYELGDVSPQSEDRELVGAGISEWDTDWLAEQAG